MEFLLSFLAMLFKMLFPVILEKAQDTSEEGSGEQILPWRETVRAGGWTDEAIEATNPKEPK